MVLRAPRSGLLISLKPSRRWVPVFLPAFSHVVLSLSPSLLIFLPLSVVPASLGSRGPTHTWFLASESNSHQNCVTPPAPRAPITLSGQVAQGNNLHPATRCGTQSNTIRRTFSLHKFWFPALTQHQHFIITYRMVANMVLCPLRWSWFATPSNNQAWTPCVPVNLKCIAAECPSAVFYLSFWCVYVTLSQNLVCC